MSRGTESRLTNETVGDLMEELNIQLGAKDLAGASRRAGGARENGAHVRAARLIIEYREVDS